MKSMTFIPVSLVLFGDPNTNVTTDSGLSAEMKTFYEKRLIQLAGPELVHAKFGDTYDVPQNNGKTIEFRRYSNLPKLTTPLTEGVTPDGQKLTVTPITGTVYQYGGYVTLSDMLIMTAIDKNQIVALDRIADQAGRTLDTIHREVLNGGTNVGFAGGVDARFKLVGGDATPANNKYLTVLDLKKAVRTLKVMNAPRINGYYVGIIHPDVAFDLVNDNEWKYPHQYVDTKEIYDNEIGAIAGIRFVETSEAKIFKADNLTAAARNLTVASYLSKVITVDEAITAAEATALAGRKIILHDAGSAADEVCEIASATAGAASAAKITLKDAPTNTPADGDTLYPGEAGAAGRDVYSTLIIGKGAYAVTKLTGGGLQYIVKQLGAGEDALNQRSTVGWKASAACTRLVETYMYRIESASTFNGTDAD